MATIFTSTDVCQTSGLYLTFQIHVIVFAVDYQKIHYSVIVLLFYSTQIQNIVYTIIGPSYIMLSFAISMNSNQSLKDHRPI